MTRRVPRWTDVRPFLRLRRLPLRPRDRRLALALTIDDLERAARRRVPSPVWHYVQDGAERQLSFARNRQAFDDVELVPHAFGQVGEPSTATTVLGRPVAAPVVLAPTGYSRMAHHEGERAVVAAAQAAGLPYALSTYATVPIADVAAAAPAADRWFQVYLMRDRAVSAAHVEQAREHGYRALVLTIDTTVTGQKLNDQRGGFAIPPRLTARTLVSMARHPAWVANVLSTEPLRFATFPEGSSYGVWGASNQLREQHVRPRDVAWLREHWDGPVVVKGILCVRDAVEAVEAGASAVVVSNHGGRQLDRSPVPLELLPDVVAAVGDRAEVYLDSGVRSGADVAAAVGLGAQAVLVGRAYLYGLMAGGRPGVDRALEILRTDLVRTMQLLGTSSIADLTPDHVRLRRASRPTPSTGAA